jgi:hypothetical protein
MGEGYERIMHAVACPIHHAVNPDFRSDLHERLIKASTSLRELANAAWQNGMYSEHARLHAKAAGVELAISYLQEYKDD